MKYLLFLFCVSSLFAEPIDLRKLGTLNTKPLDREKNIVNRRFEKSSYPFVDRVEYLKVADHILDLYNTTIDPEEVKDGDVIYLFQERSFINTFFRTIHPLINAKYILVSHQGNAVVERPHKLFQQVMEDEKLIAWFCREAPFENEKIHFLPLGLHPRSDKERVNITHVNRSLKGSNNKIVSNFLRKKSVFCSVTFRNRRYRKTVFSQMKKSDALTYFPSLEANDYFNTLLSSQFSISPNGNGNRADCYRHWECLLAGCIPIINTKGLVHVFKDLPVIYVDDYSKLTKTFLQSKYKEILSNINSYNFDKLYSDYWVNKIRNIQKSLRNS